MDYETLRLAQIPKIFPREHQVEASNAFIERFFAMLPKNVAPRIDAYVEDEFGDILLSVLLDDEVFERITVNSGAEPRKLLYNYFIMNYSPYIQNQLICRLLEFAGSLTYVVELDVEVWKSSTLGYFEFLCCIEQGNTIYLDLAKSLFVIRFWQRVYRWIALEIHESVVMLRERQFCEEEIAGLESRPTETDGDNIAQLQDNPKLRWNQFLVGDGFQETDEKRPKLTAQQCEKTFSFSHDEILSSDDDSLAPPLESTVFDVLESDFNW